jgi:hypothetical protein
MTLPCFVHRFNKIIFGHDIMAEENILSAVNTQDISGTVHRLLRWAWPLPAEYTMML